MIDGDQLMWSYVGVNRRRERERGNEKKRKQISDKNFIFMTMTH